MAQLTPAQLSAEIIATIYPNNARLVTATVVQQRMLDIVDSLGVDTGSFLATASFQTFSSSIVDNYATKIGVSASVAGITLQQITTNGSQTSASVNFTGPVTASSLLVIQNVEATSFTGSLLGTASYVEVTGSGVIVNWNGPTLQLTGSAAEADTLQSVTTRGNATSASMVVSGSFVVTGSTVITGSVFISDLLVLPNLPTSPAGLPSGTVWSNGGVLQIA